MWFSGSLTRAIGALILSTGVIVTMTATASPELPNVIKACNDTAEWPPYTFRNPDDKKSIVGVSTDVVKEIFNRQSIEFKIDLVQWKRCMASVERGRYQMLYDVSINAEREKTYLFSDPIYETRGGLYFDKAKHPDGFAGKSIEELKKYKIGSVFGYNVAPFGLDPKQTESTAKTSAGLLKQLRAGKIDLAVGYIEIFQGYNQMGLVDLSGLGHINIPGASPLIFHVAASRNETGEKIIELINKGLKDMKSDGSYKSINEKYGIAVPAG